MAEFGKKGVVWTHPSWAALPGRCRNKTPRMWARTQACPSLTPAFNRLLPFPVRATARYLGMLAMLSLPAAPGPTCDPLERNPPPHMQMPLRRSRSNPIMAGALTPPALAAASSSLRQHHSCCQAAARFGQPAAAPELALGSLLLRQRLSACRAAVPKFYPVPRFKPRQCPSAPTRSGPSPDFLSRPAPMHHALTCAHWPRGQA